MSNPVPPYRDQRAVDSDHLRILAIFHFVGAGLALIGIGFLALHFLIFRTVMTNPGFFHTQSGNGIEPFAFFALFQFFYAALGLWFVASAVLNILSGHFLLEKRHRVFSMVVAAINCLHLPLGTILGVFTLVVLSRGSVREAYGEGAIR